MSAAARALLAAALLAGCVGDSKGPSQEHQAEEARTYLAALAPMLVSRPLSADERALIETSVADGGPQAAVAAVIGAWAQDPALPDTARELIQTKLSVSGADAEINFELPGNLAEYTVQNGLPWSNLLTADYCVGDDLAQIACDTGAPYTAGILTTRAFLKARASRFNLTRASTMMNVFACEHYPLEDPVEPRIERERLRVMFRADTPEDQEDPAAADSFGNGFACYHCHGQFAWHAQLFVQFDQNGLFRAEATGLQDPAGEVGRSLDGLFASHLENPDEAKNPASQILGQPVSDLSQAGQVLASSDNLERCTAQNLIEYGVGLAEGVTIDPALLDEIAATLDAPTFADYVVTVFTNERVYDAVLEGIRNPTVPQPDDEEEPPTEDQP
ncbi:MAG TPA: hypothetical protein VMZ28_08815 [Kofleriaceae bacterium]|nr:hypothetical protein [Kofleriaceae bacterium]